MVGRREEGEVRCDLGPLMPALYRWGCSCVHVSNMENSPPGLDVKGEHDAPGVKAQSHQNRAPAPSDSGRWFGKEGNVLSLPLSLSVCLSLPLCLALKFPTHAWHELQEARTRAVLDVVLVVPREIHPAPAEEPAPCCPQLWYLSAVSPTGLIHDHPPLNWYCSQHYDGSLSYQGILSSIAIVKCSPGALPHQAVLLPQVPPALHD